MRSDFDYGYGYEVVMLHRKQGKTRLRPNDCFDKRYTKEEHWACYEKVTRGAIPSAFLKRHAAVLSARKRGRKKFDYLSYHTYWALMSKTAKNRFEVTT